MNDIFSPLEAEKKKENQDIFAVSGADSNIEIASTQNPEAEAFNQKLSRESGLPLSTVREDPELVRAKTNKIKSAKILSDNPKTSEYMSDFTNALVSHDDVEKLAEVEREWKKKHPSLTAGRLFGGFFAELKKSVSSFAAGNVMAIEGLNLEDITQVKDYIKSAPLIERAELLKAVEENKKSGLPQDQAETKALSDFIEPRRKFWTDVKDNPSLQLPEEYEQSSTGFVEDVFRGFGGSVVGMASTAAVGPLGMLGMYRQIAGQKYEDLQRQGVDKDRARRAAVMSAMGQTPLEYAGNLISIGAFKKMVKPGKAVDFLASLLETSTAEGLEEYLQSYPDEFADVYAKNPGLDTPELLNKYYQRITSEEFQSNALYSAAIGGTIGALFPISGASVNLSKSVFNIQAKKVESEAFADKIQRIGDKIDQTKTKARQSINTLKFLRNLGVDRYAYLSQEGIEKLYQGDKEQADSILDEIRAESETTDSSDLKIDVHKLINLDEGARNQLLNDIKATLDGYTKNDLKGLDVETEIKKQRDFYQEYQDSEKTYQGEINRVKSEAKKAGVPQGETDAFATLVDRFANRMGLEGLNKTEFVKKLTINRPGSMAEIKRVLNEGLGQEIDTKAENFKKWFGDSRVVDESGQPLVVYHGTTHSFDEFIKDKGNPENDLGLGFYFTNNQSDVAANYAGEGPDLTGRIELRAERIEQEEEIDYEEALKKAREELSGGSPNVIPAYVSFKNPVIIGGENETTFSIEQVYETEPFIEEATAEIEQDYPDVSEEEKQDLIDERTREMAIDNGYIDEQGSLLEFFDALRSVSYEFEEVDIQPAIDSVMTVADYGVSEITARSLVETLKNNEGLQYATDENGNLASGELIRRAFEEAGYDGIIDNTVDEKFGSQRKTGKSMEGVTPGTTHFIAFNPTQIKSVFNRGTFDPKNPNILFQAVEKLKTFWQSGEQEKYDTGFPITHGSNEKITEIKKDGLFDGIFGSAGEMSNQGGEIQNTFYPRKGKVAKRGDVSFDYDKTVDYLKKEFPDADEQKIEQIYDLTADDKNIFEYGDNPFLEYGYEDLGEASWYAQKIRGQIAVNQGFDAVAMSDEFGTSYLIPFGSKVKTLEQIKTFLQPGKQKRGAVLISGDRYAIELMQSDKSTLFHELGHVFLAEMKQIADSGSASNDFLNDYQTLSTYLNVSPDGEIDVAAQEKFAGSFERYLLDGEAPTADLRSVFRRIKEWMMSVYRTISSSNIPAQIPDEIREVMNNLFTVKQLSEEAMIENNMTTLSNEEARKLGVTQDDKRAMSDLLKKAQAEAEDEYHSDLRKFQAQWRKQAAREFEGSQTGRAIKFLREGAALDLDEVREVHGDEVADSLRKKRLAKKNGMSVLVATEQTGYKSEQELITALLTSPSKTDFIKQSVESNTTDWFNRFKPEEYINSTKPFSDYMDIKNRYINRAGGKPVEKLGMAEFAKEKLGSMPVRDAINTRRFMSDFKRHTDKERSSIRLGKKKEAADANYLARMAHAMAKQSMTMRKEVEKLQRKVKGLSNSTALTQDTLNQVRDLAARFGLIRADGKKLLPEDIQSALSQMDPEAAGEFKARYFNANDLQMSVAAVRNQVSERDRQTLESWANSKDGYEIDLADFIRNPSFMKDYKDLPFADFQELSDTFFIINHVDREERYFTALGERIRIKEITDKLLSRVEKTQKIKGIDFERNNVKEFLGNGVAVHTKMETLFRKLDGEVTGDWYHYLFEPIAEAEHARDDRLKVEAKAMREIFKGIKDPNKRVYVESLPKEFSNMRRQQAISAALNTGNSDNKAKLIEGYGWSEQQLEDLLDTLTKEDWDTVQKIWDYIETFKDDLFSVEKDIKGRTPKEIKAEAVQTKFGEYKGGYYPILYDRRLSWSSFKHGQLDDIKSLFKRTYATSNTRAGSLKERVASAGDKKIKLDLTVISDHVFEVVHDITHRKAVLNVAKLIRNKDVQTALTNTIGVNLQSQMHSWLEDVAKEQANASDVYHKLFRWARTSTSLMSMGLKFTTMAQQFVGYTQTIDELGMVQSAKGLKMFYGIGNDYAKIGDRIEFARTSSGFMRNRMQSFDRDIRDITKFGGKIDKKGINKIAFAGIGFMQMGVDLPTWYAGYDKALKDGKSHEQAVQFADSIVRQTQGAGGTKDLAKIQRGDEAIRLFTMFYSYFNTLFNLGSLRVSQIKQARLGGKVAIAASAAVWLWFVPSLLSEMVSGRGPEDDEEWWDWAFPQLANYPFQTVIGVREVANYAFSGWDYSATPAEAAPKSVADFLTTWERVIKDEKDIKEGVEQTAETAGYIFGLPLKQIIILLGNLYDYSTGDNPDFDYQDFMRRNRS